MGRWKLRGVIVGIVLVAVAGGGLAAMVGPYVRDDLVLDRVVRAAALEWRDFGREHAWERLQYELDHQEIGLQVADEDCELRDEGGRRVVHCAWEVDVGLPLFTWSHTLGFESRAVITPGGDLR